MTLVAAMSIFFAMFYPIALGGPQAQGVDDAIEDYFRILTHVDGSVITGENDTNDTISDMHGRNRDPPSSGQKRIKCVSLCGRGYATKEGVTWETKDGSEQNQGERGGKLITGVGNLTCADFDTIMKTRGLLLDSNWNCSYVQTRYLQNNTEMESEWGTGCCEVPPTGAPTAPTTAAPTTAPSLDASSVPSDATSLALSWVIAFFVCVKPIIL